MRVSGSYRIMLFQLVFLLIVGAFNTAYATEIKVHVDRSPVNLQESFQLIFTANASPDADPDFSPLNKDFEILNQSTQQSTKIVDWKTTKTIQWMGPAMLPQAGVAIGMALVASNTFHHHGQMLLTIAISSTIFFEIVGPVFTRLAIRQVDKPN